MKFVTFQGDSARPGAGVLLGEQVVALAGAGFPDMLSVLAGGSSARAKIDDFVQNPPANAACPLSALRLLAPVPRPPKLICVGMNYRDHAAETGQEIPSVPTIFTKFSNIVIGPGQPIVLPKNSRKPDY